MPIFATLCTRIGLPSSPTSPAHLLNLLHCLYESQDSSLCSFVASQLNGSLDLSRSTLSPLDCLSVGYFLSCVCQTTEGEFKVNLRACSLNGYSVGFLLKELSKCDCPSPRVEGAAAHVALPGCLALDLGKNKLEGGGFLGAGFAIIAEALRHDHKLRNLDIESCGLTDQGMESIASALEVNTTLETLDMSGNVRLTDRGLLTLGESLKKNKRLKTLNLKLSRLEQLTTGGWKLFVLYLKENHHLSSLSVTYLDAQALLQEVVAVNEARKQLGLPLLKLSTDAEVSTAMEDENKFLDTCERVMKDDSSVDLTAMHGILFGLPRSGKSSLLQRLIGNKPPTKSPSTLAAKESVKVSIQKVREQAKDTTVAIEGGDAAAHTGKAIWRHVGLIDEAVLLLNDLPQVSTSADGETMASTEPATTQEPPQEPVHNAPQEPVHSAPQEPVHGAPQEPVQDAPQEPVPAAPQLPLQDVPPPQPKPLPQPSSSQDTLAYLKECVRDKNWKELKQIMGRQWYLYLTDSGGQPEFQELIISSLVSGPSIFFLVFSFDKDLDKVYEVEFIDAQGRSITPYLSRHTTLETILQSFSSVASIERLTYIQKDGKTKPRVLLIGTHKDLVSNERIAEVEKRFQKVLKELDPLGMIEWASDSQMIFAVDNTQLPEAEDVQKIRNTVERLGTHRTTSHEYEFKIPCAWFILGIMVRKPEHPDPVLLFEECVKLGHGCGISEEEVLTEALRYLDRMIGTLRHIQNKDKDTHGQGHINFVLRNSQFLFTLVSDLIIQTFTWENAPSDRPARDEFTKKGIFDSSVFTRVANISSKLLTPAMLLTLLKQLRIVAPIQEDGNKQRYFMPCALAHVDAVKPSRQPSPVKPLLLRFSCGYVPRGMFGALIAQLLQQERAKDELQWKLDENQIFRDQITIKLKRNTKVVLRMLPTYFRITLLSPLSLASDQDDLSRLCCGIQEELIHSITQVAKFQQYGHRFAPLPCFYCPEVEEGKEMVDSHIANINKDEDGKYLECSEDDTNTWNLQEVPGCSTWLTEVINGILIL